MKDTILIHLDTDASPSAFDRIVAIDSGAAHVFSYSGITPANVVPLVHGCIFTRGVKDLQRTAIFVGGSDVAAGEAVVAEVRKAMIPAAKLTVSVMLDSNGANTTAVAAVRAAAGASAAGRGEVAGARRHRPGGAAGGPAPRKAWRSCASRQPYTRSESRSSLHYDSREGARREAGGRRGGIVRRWSAGSGRPRWSHRRRRGRYRAIAEKVRDGVKTLKVLIDLNGVPPAGIEGVRSLMDKGTTRDGLICYGGPSASGGRR